MKIEHVLEQVRDNERVKAWMQHNQDAKLVHVFFMVTGNSYSEYHVGYFDHNKQKMYTLLVNGTTIEIKEEGDLLKKENTQILPLDESLMSKDVEDILIAAKIHQEKEFPKEIPLKIMVILQNLDEVGQVYNVTYVTQSMKTLNFKIDSNTAQIKKADLVSLFETKGKPLDGLVRK